MPNLSALDNTPLDSKPSCSKNTLSLLNIPSQDEKLNIIIKDLSIVKDDIAKLIKYDGDKRKKVNTTIQKETINEEKEILLAKVTLARSVCDLEMAGFMYSMEKNELSCSVCKVGQSDDNFSFYGIFSYDHSHGLSFSDNEKLPDIFRNVKKSMWNHTSKYLRHILII